MGHVAYSIETKNSHKYFGCKTSLETTWVPYDCMRALSKLVLEK